jgi:Na+/citrate or Na+/malate symporter
VKSDAVAGVMNTVAVAGSTDAVASAAVRTAVMVASKAAVMVAITMDTITNKKTQWGGESCLFSYPFYSELTPRL